MRDLVIAVLVKDKAPCLPLYLECLARQTFPKSRTRLWIRTNDNHDDSHRILAEWIYQHSAEYKSILFDANSIDIGIVPDAPHTWNPHRFKILAGIRQQSIQYAIDNDADYMVIDADNFVQPDTVQAMADLAYQLHSGRCVVGPYLRMPGSPYSNYHHRTDANGYWIEGLDHLINTGEYSGPVKVDVIHCTYFVPNQVLPNVCYSDGSGRHEYVIFSDVLRRQGIAQYLDNRKPYGSLVFLDKPFDEAEARRVGGL